MNTDLSDESPEIDVRNNRESRAGAADSMSRVARASDGGAPPRDAPAAGERPEDTSGGVADGNPVAGVTISDEALAEAVPGDSGPMEQDGPPAGHA
jgi:hypothetical protein